MTQQLSSQPRSRRPRSSLRAGVLIATIALLLTSLGYSAAPAGAASEICADTALKSSEYSMLGVRLYRHEALARACRVGTRVTKSEARTNRIVKIGIGAFDWTKTSTSKGTAWTKHHVEAGAHVSLKIKGVGTTLNITKKHDYDFSFSASSGKLTYTTQSSSWWW